MKPEVGQARSFNFNLEAVLKLGYSPFIASHKTFEIINRIEKPSIQFKYDWWIMRCPHCDKDIIQTRLHDLVYVEILRPIGLEFSNRKNLLFYGETVDKKSMVLPILLMDEILDKLKDVAEYGDEENGMEDK